MKTSILPLRDHPQAFRLPLGSWLASRNPEARATAHAYLAGLGSSAPDALYVAWLRVCKGFWSPLLLQVLDNLVFLTAVIALGFQVHYQWTLRHVLAAFVILTVYSPLKYLLMRWLIFYRTFPQCLALARELARHAPHRAVEPLLTCWLRQEAEETAPTLDDAHTLIILFGQQPPRLTRSLRKWISAAFREVFIPRRFPFPQSSYKADLTDDQASVWVVLLKLMAQSDNPKDFALIHYLANAPTATAPNRRFVQEVAWALEEG